MKMLDRPCSIMLTIRDPTSGSCSRVAQSPWQRLPRVVRVIGLNDLLARILRVETQKTQNPYMPSDTSCAYRKSLSTRRVAFPVVRKQSHSNNAVTRRVSPPVGRGMTKIEIARVAALKRAKLKQQGRQAKLRNKGGRPSPLMRQGWSELSLSSARQVRSSSPRLLLSDNAI